MVTIGMTQPEIRKELLDWMARYGKKTGWQFMLAVAGSKVFATNDPERAKAVHASLPTMWDWLVNHHALGGFLALGKLGLWRRGSDRDVAFFRAGLVQMLSNGHVSFVNQLLLHAGVAMGLCDDLDRAGIAAERAVKCMLPDAYKLAIESGRFGTAAALYQNFYQDRTYMNEAAHKKAANEFVAAEVAAIVGNAPASMDAFAVAGWLNPSRWPQHQGPEEKPKFAALDKLRIKRNIELKRLQDAERDEAREIMALAADLGQRVALKGEVTLSPDLSDD